MLQSIVLRSGLAAVLWFGVACVAHATPKYDQVLHAYIQAWSETSVVKRDQQLAKLAIDAVKYTDEFNQVKTRAALSEMIGMLQEQIPGLRGEIIGPVRYMDKAALFEWKVYNAAGETLFYGVDAVQFADDGRLQRVDGFMNVGLK
jgi:hypothetical protein